MFKWVCIGLFLAGLTAGESRAEDRPMTSGRLAVESTSDGLTDRVMSAAYRNHRRDPFWNFPEEAERAWDSGAAAELHRGSTRTGGYTALKGALSFGRKFSSLAFVDLALGAHYLENGSGATTLPYGELSAYLLPDPRVNFKLQLTHDFIYTELVDPTGAEGPQSAATAQASLQFRPSEEIRLPLRALWRQSSDGNQKRQLEASALYGFSTGEPWIWAGLGCETLSYSRNSPAYWSPSGFVAFGPRIEAAAALYGKWSAAGALNANALKEAGTPWAAGFYGSAKIQYGHRADLLVEAYYARTQSLRGAGGWHSNAIGLNLAGPL